MAGKQSKGIICAKRHLICTLKYHRIKARQSI